MINFRLPLIETTMKIMDAKSTYSDMKAGTDITSAQYAINTYSVFTESQVRDLDSKLRSEYREIGMLQMAIDNFPKRQSPLKTQDPTEPVIVARLRLDMNGILLSMLISHGLIEQAKDFIEKID